MTDYRTEHRVMSHINGRTTVESPDNRVCGICMEATPTFQLDDGTVNCDPCYWGSSAPFYVGKGEREYDGTGRKAGITLVSQEWFVIERATGKKAGSRAKMLAAFDLCAMLNQVAGHKLPE